MPNSLLLLICLCNFILSESASLRLNHVQVAGSRNSYHLRPNPTVPQWEFDHESIGSQLDQGVYALEYDFYYDEGRFATAQHLVYDAATTCPFLVDCLLDIKKWQDAQTRKPILWVALGNKEIWTAEQWADLDAVVLSVWNISELIRPDDLRGNFGTIQQAIFTNGWPTLTEVAGKIIIILDQFETLEYYEGIHANLEGRVAFPYFAWENRSHHNAVILKMNNPHPNITLAVEQNYLVRTRSDANLPSYIRTNQSEINEAYFKVIDMSNDSVANRSELILFTVYGATNGIQSLNFSTAFVDQLLSLCSADNETLALGNEFDCYQRNSNYSIFSLTNYSTLNDAYQRQEQALQVGAHHISSDYPTLGTGQNDSYFLNMSIGPFYVLCNPITTVNDSLPPNITNATALPFCDINLISQEYYLVSPPKDWSTLIILVSVIGGTIFCILLVMIYHAFHQELKSCFKCHTTQKEGKEYVTLERDNETKENLVDPPIENEESDRT